MPIISQRAFAWAIILCKMADFQKIVLFFEYLVLFIGFEPGRLKRRVQDKSHAHAQNGAIFVPQIGGKIISWTLLFALPGSAPIYGAGKKKRVQELD